MTERHADTSDEQCAIVCMIVSNPGNGDRPHAWQKRVNDLIRALRDERNELSSLFDLRHKADMRAIRRWQEAHPGKDNEWPDRADMVAWLLAEVERLSAILRPWQRIAQDYIEARDDCDLSTDDSIVSIKTSLAMGTLRATAALTK